MKKRVIKINLSNKLFYSIIVIAAILLIGTGVYAWTAGGTGNPGHSIQDVAAPSVCLADQYLKYTGDYMGGTWNCATPPTGSGLTCDDCQYSFEDLSPVPYGCDNPGEHLYFDSVGAYYGTWKCGGVPLTSVSVVTDQVGPNYAAYYVSCPSGRTLVGGGCRCSDGYITISDRRGSSNPNDWYCACSQTGAITATAFCMS